jgi:NAD-specific glutamate dehydrogenase
VRINKDELLPQVEQPKLVVIENPVLVVADQPITPTLSDWINVIASGITIWLGVKKFKKQQNRRSKR